jgi:hypothetical protein
LLPVPQPQPRATAVLYLFLLFSSLQPLDYQQTLIKSFTVGGVGLHTAEYGESAFDLMMSNE